MRWAKIGVLLTIAALPLTARGQGTTAQSGQAGVAAQVYITRQRAFSFPVTLPPAGTLGGEAAVIELWFSTDRGANWQKYDSRRPDAGPFVVQTDRDGEYWFASRILDALNRVLYQPPNLPEHRVIVDTVPPRMEFTASAGPTGEVQGQWRVYDEFLKPESLTLECQAAPNQPWHALAFERPHPGSMQTTVAGAATWFPQSREPAISLKATVLDHAGNSTVVTRLVTFSPTAPNAAPLAAAPPSPALPNSAPTAQLTPQYVPVQPPPNHAPFGPPAAPATPPMTAAPSAASPPVSSASPSPAPRSTAVDPIPWPADNSGSTSSQGAVSDSAHHRPDAMGDDRSAAPRVTHETASSGPSSPGRLSYPSHDSAPRVSPVADDGGPRRLSASPAPLLDPRALPGGERPRMTNSRKFSLEYDVSSVGPQGVARVELWITRDGGQNWQAWSTDPDCESPMEVTLDQEGVYGFRVVVTGRNGLSGQVPNAGEMADVWVGVDATPPTVRLTAAKCGAGPQAGQLEIRWDASDAALAARPVTLLFSENPNGPWTIVATGLPNTGSYLWHVDPRTPQRIFLRLEVRDEAGNLGLDQLREPVSLEGLQPKARVRGLQPIGRIEFGAMRPALFR